jgi:hypothetical protein
MPRSLFEHYGVYRRPGAVYRNKYGKKAFPSESLHRKITSEEPRDILRGGSRGGPSRLRN